MRLRQRLAGLGFHECQTIKLIADAHVIDALPLKPLQPGDTIRVSLPLSEDHAVLRPSLVPGLIASAERNLRQQAPAIRLFEMGRFFRNAGGGKAKDLEAESIALLISGNRQPESWSQKAAKVDLYDLKAVIQALIPGAPLQLVPKDKANFALGADLHAAGQNIGSFAMLSPARQREIDSPAPVFVAELELAKLRKLAAVSLDIAELPQFPGSSRDVTFDAPAALANAEIEKAFGKLQQALLVSFECVDLFTDPSGEKLAADRKAITYRLHYRAADRTLNAHEIDTAHQQALATLTKQLGIGFR